MPDSSGDEGVSVAVKVLASYDNVAGTVAPAEFFKVKTIEDACIAWLNVAVAVAVLDTPVAPVVGDMEVTEGAAAVLNVHVNGDGIVLPDSSVAPLTVAV